MVAKKVEIGFAAALFLCGLWVMSQGASFGVFGDAVVGAGLFPLMTGGLMSICAAGTALRTLRELRAHGLPSGENDGEDDNADFEGAYLPAVIGSMAVLGVYALLIEPLGMVLVTPFLVAAISVLIKVPKSARDFLVLMATSLGFTFFAWVLFKWTLHVPLTVGPFGF